MYSTHSLPTDVFSETGEAGHHALQWHAVAQTAFHQGRVTIHVAYAALVNLPAVPPCVAWLKTTDETAAIRWMRVESMDTTGKTVILHGVLLGDELPLGSPLGHPATASPMTWHLAWVPSNLLDAEIAHRFQQPLVLGKSATLCDLACWQGFSPPWIVQGTAQSAQAALLHEIFKTLPTGLMIDPAGQLARRLPLVETIEVIAFTAGALPLQRFALPGLMGALLQGWPESWQNQVWQALTRPGAAFNTLGAACQQLVEEFPALLPALRNYLPKAKACPLASQPLTRTFANVAEQPAPRWRVISLQEVPQALRPVVEATLLEELLSLPPEFPLVWASSAVSSISSPTESTQQQLTARNGKTLLLYSGYGAAAGQHSIHTQALTLDYVWPMETAQPQTDTTPHDVAITACNRLTHQLPLRYNLPGSLFQGYGLPAEADTAWEPTVAFSLVEAQPAEKLQTKPEPSFDMPEMLPENLSDRMAGEVETPHNEIADPEMVDRGPQPTDETDLDALMANRPLEGAFATSEEPILETHRIHEADDAHETSAREAIEGGGIKPAEERLADAETWFALPGEGGSEVREPTVEDSLMAVLHPPDQDTPTPASAVITNPATGNTSLYEVGMMVVHPRYGRGVVEGVIPTGKRTTLRIRFEEVGKRLLDAEQSSLEVV